MANVIDLPVITRLDLNPDRVLDGAREKLNDVIVMGWDKNGDLYFASSQADGGDALWLMEKAKLALMEV